MIKVIQAVTDTNIGGAGIWLLNFLKTYDRSLIDMSVIVPRNSMLKERIEELKVRVIEVDETGDRSFSMGGVKSIGGILKKEKPDIVHTHASLSARIAAKRLGIKVVHTRHCIEDGKPFIKKELYGFVNNILSDRVIGVSKAVCQNLLADGIDKKKLRIVYNGIFPLNETSKVNKQIMREKYGISDKNIVVGMVARLEPVKNHMMFLESAKVISTICPEAVFMIVGNGSMEEKLKARVKELDMDNKVVFTGYISDVNDIMNIIDIHVLTSEKEALSISLIEAMSLAKPVVATDSGGPAEVVSNGVSGILIPVGDALGFAMGVVRFIQRPDIAKKAGEAGKNIVYEKFLADKMAREIEDIYKELV